MNWLELPPLLRRLSQTTVDTIAARRAAHPSSSGIDFKSVEIPLPEEARHIRAFISDFKWPDDTPDGFLFGSIARLYQAELFVEYILSESKEIPMNHIAHRQDLPEGSLLFWLLTDYWNYAGCWRQFYRCSKTLKPSD